MRLKATRFFIALLAVCFLGQILSAQTPAPTTGAGLTIEGEVAKPAKLSLADLAKLPHKTVKATGHDGKENTYEGVPLIDILSAAGVPFGEQLRGQNLALF